MTIDEFCKKNRINKVDYLKLDCENSERKILLGGKNILHQNKTNIVAAVYHSKNDIISIIGPPSTKSDFNENIWFYIDRRKTNQSLIKLGAKKIEKNNILMVEFNERAILKNKKLFDLNNLNDIKYVKSITQKEFKNSSKKELKNVRNMSGEMSEKCQKNVKWPILAGYA